VRFLSDYRYRYCYVLVVLEIVDCNQISYPGTLSLLTLPSSPNNHFSGSTMQPIIDFNAQAFVCEAQVITWMRTRFNQISGLCVPPWCSSLCMVLPALREMSLFNTYTGIPICMSCCSWYSEYLVPGTLCLPGTLVPALSLSTPV